MREYQEAGYPSRIVTLVVLLLWVVSCATDTIQPIKGSVAEHRGSLIVPNHDLKNEVEGVLDQLLEVAGQRQGLVKLLVVRHGEGLAVASSYLREINIAEELLDVARDRIAPGVRRMMFANVIGHELAHVIKGHSGHHPDTELEADRLAIEWSQKAGYGCLWLVAFRKQAAGEKGWDTGRFITTWGIHPDLAQRAYEQAQALCPVGPHKLPSEEAVGSGTVSCPEGAVWTGSGCIAEEKWNR